MMVTCGELVRRCLSAARILEDEGISCEIIDLRTIVPLDVETIINSVAKTGHFIALTASSVRATCAVLGWRHCRRAAMELMTTNGRADNMPTTR